MIAHTAVKRPGNGNSPGTPSDSKPPSKPKNQKPPVKVLGPVSRLEEHVHPNWWRGIFNSLYLKTDADVVDDQVITRQEVNLFLDILKPATEDRILDLCCGQGRHSLELARRGFRNIEGLDRSHYLVERARAAAEREGLGVRFREGDARKLAYATDSFDVVMILGNSFGYFESLQDDLRVLKEVARVLKPWGKILIDVADGNRLRKHFQPRSWEWMDNKHFVCRERELSVDGQRLISREVITHVEKGVIGDQFYAERLYTQDSIARLMKEAGFNDFAFHGTISPNSQRNQDLGMMEQRRIVTGIMKKDWTPQKRKPREAVTNVVVIMGDPTKKDPVKPDAVFDDDDFYTIDQMKDALRNLKGFQFTYLNNHNTLVQDLCKAAGKVDFALNLCDEGFDNDARKELHVPAILEACGISYTGAGPQCLAFCYDKSLVRGIASEMGMPVPLAFFVESDDAAFDIPFGFPMIVKPNFGDSSFGITQHSVVESLDDLLMAITGIRERFGYEKPILVEEFLTGNDLSVGIIGNPDTSYRVLPITEEDYSGLPPELPRICGYEAKWDPESPDRNIKSVPANLPETTEKEVVEWCLKLFERLECADYARFDWRLDASGNPKLLEVNPNPGWCWDGHLAKMTKYAGMSYSEMLEAILRAAEQRLKINRSNGDR